MLEVRLQDLQKFQLSETMAEWKKGFLKKDNPLKIIKIFFKPRRRARTCPSHNCDCSLGIVEELVKKKAVGF